MPAIRPNTSPLIWGLLFFSQPINKHTFCATHVHCTAFSLLRHLRHFTFEYTKPSMREVVKSLTLFGANVTMMQLGISLSFPKRTQKRGRELSTPRSRKHLTFHSKRWRASTMPSLHVLYSWNVWFQSLVKLFADISRILIQFYYFTNYISWLVLCHSKSIWVFKWKSWTMKAWPQTIHRKMSSSSPNKVLKTEINTQYSTITTPWPDLCSILEHSNLPKDGKEGASVK